MPAPNFSTTLTDKNGQQEITITAGPAVWTLAVEYVAGPVKLKIEAVDPEALWQFAANQFCTATGTAHGDAAAILPAAPIGALIGKLGGSSADIPPVSATAGQQGALPAGIKLFAVGNFAIIDVKDTDSGPLFLAMNDALAGFANHGGKLKIKAATGA